MNRKHQIIIYVGLALSIALSFYITRNKNENKNSVNKNAEDKNSAKMTVQKPKLSSESSSKPDETNSKNPKNMSPSEYIAWVKDPSNRVLLEIKEEGSKIYRKGNVTITVMPDGKELYMPDEF